MEYGAIDLHKKESQIRIVTESGEMLDRRIATTRERFTALFWGRRADAHPAGGVDRERVGRAAPRGPRPRGDRGGSEFLPMYGQRSRRVKTDRRDVAALAEACQRGCYRAAHRRSAPQRTVQAHLNVRRELTDSPGQRDPPSWPPLGCSRPWRPRPALRPGPRRAPASGGIPRVRWCRPRYWPSPSGTG